MDDEKVIANCLLGHCTWYSFELQIFFLWVIRSSSHAIAYWYYTLLSVSHIQLAKIQSAHSCDFHSQISWKYGFKTRRNLKFSVSIYESEEDTFNTFVLIVSRTCVNHTNAIWGRYDPRPNFKNKILIHRDFLLHKLSLTFLNPFINKKIKVRSDAKQA